MAVSIITIRNYNWGVMKTGGKCLVNAIVGPVHYGLPTPDPDTFYLYDIYVNNVLYVEKSTFVGQLGESGNGNISLGYRYEDIKFTVRVDEVKCYGVSGNYDIIETITGVESSYTIHRATITNPSPSDEQTNVILTTPANPYFTWKENYDLEGDSPENVFVHFYLLGPGIYFSTYDLYNTDEFYTRAWYSPLSLYGRVCTWRLIIWNQWGSNTYNYSFSWMVEGYVAPPDDLTTFPATRPDDYDPDLIWTPGEWDGEDYTPSAWDSPEGVYVAAGGGRWGQNLVVAGNQKIYYEDYS